MVVVLLFFLDKSRNLSKIVSVLLSASVERFFVSRMRDFCITLRLLVNPLIPAFIAGYEQGGNFFLNLFFIFINHATSPKLYRSRDSLSPVCGIF